jgi:hypothetical protein
MVQVRARVRISTELLQIFLAILSWYGVYCNRILLTHHCDLTIRFQDISAQLLIRSPSSPVATAFPHPLSSLIIDLITVLSDLSGPYLMAAVRTPHHILGLLAAARKERISYHHRKNLQRSRSLVIDLIRL